MKKTDFLDYYNKVIKVLGERFEKEYEEFSFFDNPQSLYEEYLNTKTLIRTLYEKQDGADKTLLDRHKVCACMTVAIIKVRLISKKTCEDSSYELKNATRVNEQLAFMSSWELFKGFLRMHDKDINQTYELPKTFHNDSFMDTITRSLFYANQINELSVPLLANVFYLLEINCKKDNQTLGNQTF